jgi:hypothetical protein
MEELPQWQGPTPFYLVIQIGDARTIIDLDESGWATTYAGLLREPGLWVLMHKEHQFQPLMVVVHPGDQPYYTARHVGITGSGGSNEVVAYGIGKKRPDGSVNRMWTMPNGIICSGDDVDDIGIRLVKAIGPK